MSSLTPNKELSFFFIMVRKYVFFLEISRVTEGPSLDEIVLETDTTDFDAFLRS